MSEVDIKKFAERVERLCDFLLDKMSIETGLTGSESQKILEDLKDDAANIKMFGGRMAEKTLDGLHEFMRGFPKVSEPEEH